MKLTRLKEIQARILEIQTQTENPGPEAEILAMLAEVIGEMYFSQSQNNKTIQGCLTQIVEHQQQLGVVLRDVWERQQKIDEQTRSVFSYAEENFSDSVEEGEITGGEG